MEQALARLHPYTIGHMGDLNEWYYDWDDWDFQHRHQSHLIGLYPGSHLSTPQLLKAAERSLEIKGDKTTGWSTGWRINLWARLRNAQQAFHIYQKPADLRISRQIQRTRPQAQRWYLPQPHGRAPTLPDRR